MAGAERFRQTQANAVGPHDSVNRSVIRVLSKQLDEACARSKDLWISSDVERRIAAVVRVEGFVAGIVNQSSGKT